VINGGNEGWFGLEEGELAGDGDVAGEEVVSIVGDITAAMFDLLLLDLVHQARNFPKYSFFRLMCQIGGSLPASLVSHQREWLHLLKKEERFRKGSRSS
jgi:hypothetical protein